jgi:hypothetical protein
LYIASHDVSDHIAIPLHRTMPMPSKLKLNRIALTKIMGNNDNNAIYAALMTRTTTDVLCAREAIDNVILLKKTSTTESSTSEFTNTDCLKEMNWQLQSVKGHGRWSIVWLAKQQIQFLQPTALL